MPCTLSASWAWRPTAVAPLARTLGLMTETETALAELRELAFERGYESPFPTQVNFEQWADKVAPRVQFDPKLAARFIHAAELVRSQYAFGSNPLGSINEAIGLLNQAILTLESHVRAGKAVTPVATAQPPQAPLELPAKITLKWLYAHAPVSLAAWFVGLLAAAFLAGIAVTELPLYQSLRPRTAEAKSSAAIVPLAPQQPNRSASSANEA